MKVIICENYEEASLKTADLFTEQIKEKPNSVLGFATGSTPVGAYQILCERCQKGELDFSRVTTFNLDEYYPISPEHDQSYRYFMQKNLFDHVNVLPEKTFVPRGDVSDVEKECARYDCMIRDAGGIDLQILGIGHNGHIAFNEPDEELIAGTHKTALTQRTIEANARFFASEKDVPRYAVTMGVGIIMEAKKIVIVICGKDKHEALSALLSGKITTKSPATMLNMHRDVTVICDKAAYEG